MEITNSSRIFAPARAVGVVTDGSSTPFIARLGSETFCTVSCGRGFQVYRVSNHLRLSLVSPRLPRAVTCLVSRRDETFVATEGECDVTVFKRASRVAVLRGSAKGDDDDDDDEDEDGDGDEFKGSSAIVSMCLFGSLLVTLTRGGLVTTWVLPSRFSGPEATAGCVVHSAVQLELDQRGGEAATVVVHPDTLMNKVVVGTTAGRLLLLNVKTVGFERERREDGMGWEGTEP